MMQQMRRNTKWIMILAVLAFAGLMFFEWGMDITGQSSGSLGEIGSVNGTPVLYDQYMGTYRRLYDQAAESQEDPITGAQIKELEDDAWEEMVNSIVIEQELERRGIVVTDEELINAARYYPPPEVIADPNYQTDGVFDVAKYQRFISVASRDVLLSLEAYYRNLIPRTKLLRQIGSGVYVSDGDLWDAYRSSHERTAVRYVSFDPLVRVSDEEFEISPDEVAGYYDEKMEDFFVAASAKVVVVPIPKTPTATDTAAVLTRIEELRQAVLDGEDFGELARAESADEGSAPEGGDLGVFAKSAMVLPFDSAVFASPIGRVTPPVRSSFGVHIIEVMERWGQDSARARHILRRFERTDDSEIELYTVADSLEELGESIALSEAAATLGLEADTVEFLETFPFIPGVGDASEGADWAFDPEIPEGEASPVFENRDAFYSVELISREPSRYLTLEEAEHSIRSSIAVDKKVEVAMAEARALVDEVRSGRTLDEVAREMGAGEVGETVPFSRVEEVPGLGRYNAAIGAAFGLEVGEVSDAVRAGQNVLVVERVSWEAADSAAWLAQLDAQRSQLMGALRDQRMSNWIEGLRESADVVDRRDEVLNRPEEEQQLQLPAIF